MPKLPRRDLLIALAATLGMELELALERGVAPDARVVSALGALGGLGLAWRRRRPLVSPAALVTVIVASTLAGGILLRDAGAPILVCVVAAAGLGGASCGARTVQGLALLVGGLTIANQLDPANHYAPSNDAVFFGIILGAATIAGRLVAERRRTAGSLRDRQRRTPPPDQAAAAALIEERTRLSEELHDVIAHRVGEIAVQAGATERVAPGDDERALAALAVIESTARDTLVDIRDVLGFLRCGTDEGLALSPQPSLRRLDTLIDPRRRQGVTVHLEVDGDPGALDPGVDVTACRVIQEGLSSISDEGSVQVRYGPRTVSVSVGGAGAEIADTFALRQRVELFGGRITRDRAGISARLPRRAG